MGKTKILILFWSIIGQVLSEPSCTWNHRQCPTLKCVEATSDFLSSTLKLKDVIQEEYPILNFPSNSTEKILDVIVPCMHLEITHSNVTSISKTDFQIIYPEKYNQIKLSGINLIHLDEDIFKEFINIKRIFLDHNEIFFINLTALNQLEELYLNHNRLEELTSSNMPLLPSLQVLNVESNKLSQLDLCSFKNLSSVSVSYNKLSVIDEQFKCNHLLVDLDLSFNVINSIKVDSFSALKLLETLSLNDNNIFTLERVFAGLENLRNLHLQNNNLEEITTKTFKGLTNLNVLLLDNNRLKRIDPFSFSDLAKLTEISLWDNPFHVLYGDTFFGLASLLHLDLSNLVINYIKEDAFNGLLHLKSLDLHNSSITDIDSKCFNGMPNLDTLNLRNNSFYLQPRLFFELTKLTNLILQKPKDSSEFFLEFESFIGLESLKQLNLSSFGIVFLSSGVFSGLNSLQELNLSYNNITILTAEIFMGMPNLITLDLRNNRIKKIDADSFYELINLQSIDLGYNEIRLLQKSAFRGLKNLPILSLYGLNVEEIESGAFDGLDNCQFLNLTNNKIKEIKKDVFSDLPKLFALFLDHNQITFIEPGAFANLTNLKFFSLKGNNINTILNNTFLGLENLSILNLTSLGITTIEAGALNGLNALSVLDLSNNSIRVIPSDLFNTKPLVQLNLRSNLITEIAPKVFQYLNHTWKLGIDNNSLSTLKKDYFYGLTSVTYLNLSNTNINQIKPGAFNGLRLHALDLTGNPLEKIEQGVFYNFFYTYRLMLNSGLKDLSPYAFDGLSTMPLLQIDYGNFSEIRGNTFKGMRNLKLLHLKNTQIGTVRTNGFVTDSKLYLLILKNCTIDSFESESIPLFNIAINRDGAETLYIPSQTNYNFSRLSIKNLDSNIFTTSSLNTPFQSFSIVLRSLNFNHNQLSAIKSETFNSDYIIKLTLDYNLINNIEPGAFSKMKALEYLSITFNDLKTIKSGTFLNCDKLKHLHLEHNNLTSLGADSFRGLSSLSQLLVSFNKLKTLPSLFLMPNLLSLQADYNNLGDFDSCSPNLYELHIRGNSLTSLNLQEKCSSLKVIDFRDNNIYCSSIESFTKHCLTMRCIKDNVVSGLTHRFGFSCIADAHKTKENQVNLSKFLLQLNGTASNYKKTIDNNKKLTIGLQNVSNLIENMTNVKIITDYNRSLHIKKHHSNTSKELGIFEILLIVVCVLICLQQLIKLVIYGINYSKKVRVRSDSI